MDVIATDIPDVKIVRRIVDGRQSVDDADVGRRRHLEKAEGCVGKFGKKAGTHIPY